MQGIFYQMLQLLLLLLFVNGKYEFEKEFAYLFLYNH